MTFAKPLTPAQAQSVLTAGGNIPVKQLYLSDGSRVSDADSIGSIFTGGGDQRITGAAVYCSGSFAAELQDNPEVFLIEVMEASDFENAAPVDIAEIQTGEVTLPPTEVTEPGAVTPVPVTDVPGSSEDGTVEPTEDSAEMDGTAEPEPTSSVGSEDFPPRSRPRSPRNPRLFPPLRTARLPLRRTPPSLKSMFLPCRQG